MKTGDYIVFAGPLDLNLPIGYSCKFDTKYYGMFLVTKRDEYHYDFDPVEESGNDMFCPFTIDVRDWPDGFIGHCTVTDSLYDARKWMREYNEKEQLKVYKFPPETAFRRAEPGYFVGWPDGRMFKLDNEGFFDNECFRSYDAFIIRELPADDDRHDTHLLFESLTRFEPTTEQKPVSALVRKDHLSTDPSWISFKSKEHCLKWVEWKNSRCGATF